MVRVVIGVKGGCVTSVVASEDVEVLGEDMDAGEVGPTVLDIDAPYVDEIFEEYEGRVEPDA